MQSKTVPWGINPLANHNMVGYTSVQKVRKMQYRQQKAWARSVHIEIKKERQRVQEESRSIDIRQQIAILHAISKEQWNKRQQKPLMRYFRLPQPLSEMMRDD